MMEVELLVIDDDEINNLIMAKILKAAGINKSTKFYTSAGKALHFLRSASDEGFPEHIIIDLDMPVLDGFGFLDAFEEQFSEQYPDTEIVVLTTSIMDRDRKRAEDYSCVKRFLSKPLGLKDVHSLF